MNFKEELQKRTEEAEQVIRMFLPKEEGFPAKLAEAMNYSMLAGGKRLRPILLLESYRIFGGEGREAKPFAAALEMIHTHSLIHDDMPEIDNDAYRRGRKTTHVVYGDALALLSGDALLNFAYETACRSFDEPGDLKRKTDALRLLLAKTGIRGMLGGQSVDVMNEKGQTEKPDLKMLSYIYLHKTAALLEAPLMAGVLLAGAEEHVKAMEEIGRCMGLAFQIRDDILDVTGTEEELGKPIHSDEKNEKVTYVTLLGLEEAKAEICRLTEKGLDLLGELPGDTAFLKELFLWLADRTY